MKKLKLKALDLGANEVLSRAQLKNILGGDGSGGGSGNTTCTATADCGSAPAAKCSGINHCSARDGWGATCDRNGAGDVYTVKCA